MSAGPVVILSHGRSGSTLLLELLAQDPQFWTSYEPLQEVRQPYRRGEARSSRNRARWPANGRVGPGAARARLHDRFEPRSTLSVDASHARAPRPGPLLVPWFTGGARHGAREVGSGGRQTVARTSVLPGQVRNS